MGIWIALLRGINVGGKNKLPMAELVSAMETLGFHNVKTYIQSGNVVFQSSSKSPTTLATKIKQAITSQYDFSPYTIVISKDELLETAAENPFPKAADEANGKTLHLFFFNEKPKDIDSAALDAIRDESESWKIKDRTFYLHTPDGFHKSKLAAKVERVLGVDATARNWRTVSKIIELANSVE